MYFSTKLGLLSFLVLLMLACAPIPEKPGGGIGEIYGVIKDESTGQPIPGVTVILIKEGSSTQSDDSGVYSHRSLTTGSYDLKFTQNGYADLTLHDVQVGYGEHYKLDVILKRSSLSSQDFSERRRGTVTYSTQSNKGEEKELPAEAPEPVLPQVRTHQRTVAPLQAASHNDNEEFPYFLDYLKRFSDVPDVYHRDFKDRFTVRIVDGNDKPLFNIPFTITREGKTLWQAVSYTHGENVVFPGIMFPAASSDRLHVNIHHYGNTVYQEIMHHFQRITEIKLNQSFQTSEISLDLLFILDTTGSMCDEIKQLQDNIYSIYTRINNYFQSVPIRFGLILYRDQGDRYLVKKHQFTESIDEFQLSLDQVSCGGGGDNPEDIQTALDEAVQKMDWAKDACKLSFLLADAPPHLDYDQDFTYLDAALAANRKGIKIYSVGASGLNIPGEYVFRQLSALTYSEFIFLTYGESGESDGTGTGKVSHHTGGNYESQRLDDLVVNSVKKELSYQLPAERIARRSFDPGLQEGYLKIRLDNLWIQIIKGMKETMTEEPVAVLAPIETPEEELFDLALYLQQMSTVTLLENYRLKIVERERLEEILEEMGLSLTGILEEGDFETLFRLLKSNIIFIGDLNYAGMDPVIFMRAVSTETGALLAAARIRL